MVQKFELAGEKTDEALYKALSDYSNVSDNESYAGTVVRQSVLPEP